MKNRKKIFFVLPTLLAGGAERVMSFVSQNLDKDKFDVTLVVIGLEKESKFKVIGVPVIFLNKTRVLRGFFPLSMLIKNEKPQIVVSSISHLNAMMGLIGVIFPKIKLVGRHASILSNTKSNNKKKLKKPFRKFFFDYYRFGTKNLDYYICQSADMKKSIIQVYDIDPSIIHIINNPVTQSSIIKEKVVQNEVKKYITVGRLSKTKGHLRILNILSKLSFPFQYTIIGEGPFYNKIFNKAKELGIENNIKHINHTNEVFKYLVEHDMFLQGSYSEGFPNALLESCVVGTPAIAFKSPGGTKEIVENGVNGYIVENEEEFIKRLSETKEWDPKTVRESVNTKFSKTKIINDYENFFHKILD